MERPKIKDAATLAYVEHLEKQLSQYTAHPLHPLYLVVKKQCDALEEALGKFTLDLAGLDDKDDKAFDRWLKLMTESKRIGENLEYYISRMKPQEKVEAKAEEGSVEDFAFNKKKTNGHTPAKV
jgi:hypothetical protein